MNNMFAMGYISYSQIIVQDGAPQWCERWFINHELIPII